MYIRGIILVKVEIESDYINGETHKPRGVTEVIILEEFKPVSGDYGDKFTGKVQCNGTHPEAKLWAMNNTSAKALKKIFGEDTLQWIQKKVAIYFSPTNIRGEMVDVIYVDRDRTISLNVTQTQIPTEGTPPAAIPSTTPPQTPTEGTPPPS